MEIEDRLKKMIVERLYLKVEAETIENDASLIKTYGVDSVSLLELVVGLEDEFDLEIDDDDFDVENFETVSALRDFVKERLD